MPQSLDLTTSTDRKRQRSRDSRKPADGSNGSDRKGSSDTERLARNGVRMPAYLSKTKSEIAANFDALEWQQRQRMHHAVMNSGSPFKLDRSWTVLSRNRYQNIQPWDNSRVRLKTTIAGSDYVNASPIKLRSHRRTKRARSNSSASTATLSEYNYIATQGPKEGQFSHFWHMVMQETTGPVGVIVMLTKCYEANKEKCGQYFPSDEDHPIVLPSERIHGVAPKPPDDGDPFIDTPSSSAGTDSWISGTNTSSPLSEAAKASDNEHEEQSDKEAITEAGVVEMVSMLNDIELGAEVRELKVTIGGLSKTIYHYLYMHWPDFGKPEAEERAALMRLIKVSRQTAGESPRIVHCSAGVGRTGTFIALDFLTGELESGRLARRASGLSTGSEDNQQQQQQSDSLADSQAPKRKQQATTPELQPGEDASSNGKEKETDLIHQTVDSLRQQRMMMVMNELQYSLLYEILRETFVAMYAEKEVGVVVTGPAEEEQGEPSPKVRRRSQASSAGDLHAGGSKPAAAARKSDVVVVDTVSDVEVDAGGTMSEAETEIEGLSSSGSGPPPQVASPGTDQEMPSQVMDDEDPYAAVAPESIRQGIRMEREER
ncbi:uncharacterized protein HMPREF1541_06226 [Cyphellophora europaea CBS 101466]|uniref:Uncharacterized protein n=1 Tax=Cyphellophora europaea (strain CBS 101466) TaxID=1220924 RepID=W2RPE3_CYPE1|nr:uncharacterized protein HMPREF1541_06226 [Cyphellophora europaea CBS 101466]ETN38195.1 hypothetical protein HMPREF1541_06226 [Cyphellophora europaea CBS 101466]